MDRQDLYTLTRSLFIPSAETEASEFQKLTVEHYDVDVKVAMDFTATTKVEIVFRNPNDTPVGGQFVFPLPDQILFPSTSLEMCIDGIDVESQLLEQRELGDLYRRVLQTRDAQALLAIGTSASSIDIPPILGEETYRIQIRYTELALETAHDAAYTHHLWANQPIANFSMSIDIEGKHMIGEIECPSYDVEIKNIDFNRTSVTYQASDITFQRDFVCRYSSADDPLSTTQRYYCESMPVFEGRIYRNIHTAHRSRHRIHSYPDHNPLTPPNGAPYHDVYHKGHGTNPFIDTEDDKQSTFGMDTDTASYALTRRYLRNGYLPPVEAIRVEEFVNAFEYDYPLPTAGTFAVHLEGAPSKFGEVERCQLLRIGIQGRVVAEADRKDAVLTFVIDVSGSMHMENRLGLVKRALRLLVEQLRTTDKVGIVVYGSNARVVLPHTSIANREHILAAIDSLHPEGATNLEDGLDKGYKLARSNLGKECINRVILCSDGVANQGQTGSQALLKNIRDYANDHGILLTTVGFGMGNFNDELMEELAKKGDGNYAYVDTLDEARRIFVEELTGTLQTIAKDAKVQVEFNPETVARFRLLGYENRQMAHEDYRNDEADAGEIGAGHSVTAVYEFKLKENVDSGNLAEVSIRYEDPDTQAVIESNAIFHVEDLKTEFEEASPGSQFAATVAHFAEILRESFWAKKGCLKSVERTLTGLLREHPKVGVKAIEQTRLRTEELLELVRRARDLKEQSN